MKIGIPFFISIIYILSCTSKKSVSDSSLQHFETLLNHNIKIQKDRFYEIEKDLISDLHEPKKYNYEFLFKAAGKSLRSYEKFYEFKKEQFDSPSFTIQTLNYAQRSNLINTLSAELSKIDNSIITLFDSCLTTNYKIIGLRKNEMESRLKGIRENLSELQLRLMPTVNEDIMMDEIFIIKLQSIELAAVHKAHFFIEKFRELAGGMTLCGFNPFYPIVQTNKNRVAKGEYFDANISIGKHFDFHPSNMPKLIVNGDTLNFGMNEKFVNYKFKTRKKGEEILNIECEVNNVLTGEKLKTSLEYIVEVD